MPHTNSHNEAVLADHEQPDIGPGCCGSCGTKMLPCQFCDERQCHVCYDPWTCKDTGAVDLGKWQRVWKTKEELLAMYPEPCVRCRQSGKRCPVHGMDE
jgi:hypothetical protein